MLRALSGKRRHACPALPSPAVPCTHPKPSLGQGRCTHHREPPLQRSILCSIFKACHGSGNRGSVRTHGKVTTKLLRTAQKGLWEAGFPGSSGGLEAALAHSSRLTSQADCRLALQVQTRCPTQGWSQEQGTRQLCPSCSEPASHARLRKAQQSDFYACAQVPAAFSFFPEASVA